MDRPDQYAINRVVHETDVLILGGGTAGCLAAVEIRERHPGAAIGHRHKSRDQKTAVIRSLRRS